MATSFTNNRRQPYHRETSWNSPYHEYHTVPPEHDLAESQTYDVLNVHGLGLSNIPHESNRIKRVPVGSKSDLRFMTSPSHIEPPSIPINAEGVLSQVTTANNTPGQVNDPDGAKWPSAKSSQYSLTDGGLHRTSSSQALLDHNNGEHYCDGCPTHGDVLKNRMSWFTTTIMILAVYSTTFSAIFLGIAFAKPRWGHKIGTQGNLSLSTATLLSAFFSKTIELSFVTVFVATLGQMLSRKAFISDLISKARGGGISIAQINMRLWILQPGTLITNWIGIRYALPTVLGILTLFASISAIFYTTAAEGLVSPKLKMGKYELRQLSGKVSASFANSIYLSDNCQTPIPLSMEDAEDRGGTCLQINHAGQGFHNFDSWITEWARKIEYGNMGPDDERPVPLAILYDNTTINGQWIAPSGENITADSQRWGRLVQNVTMVMPHANLFNAVRDPINGILQPNDLQGAGEYVVQAAIPVPAVNVLCAGLSASELAPMIINNKTKLVPVRAFRTALDEIFGWQPESASYAGDVAPWFGKAPKEYNTVANFTNWWGQSGIYLLANPPNATATSDYVLCSMRSMQYPNCTTSYHVAESGGNLTVHCDSDKGNVLPYSRYVSTAPVGKIEKNWKDVAVEWVRAVALTHGINDGDAAIARILTQMIPAYNNQTFAKLEDDLPSFGEGLGVLTGCTLLLSTSDAPFTHEWIYSDTRFSLEQPKYETFEALVAYKDYASGGSQRYQGILYIILISTFVINCWCLTYLAWNFWHYGHVTDYTEPQNLFALAINSPPSKMLAGACGGGPSGNMLGKKWCVDMAYQPSSTTSRLDLNNTTATVNASSAHPHFYVRSTEENVDLTTPQPYLSPMADPSSLPNTPVSPSRRVRFAATLSPRLKSRPAREVFFESTTSAHESSNSTTQHKKPTRLKSMDDLNFDDRESPALQQYYRLTGKS